MKREPGRIQITDYDPRWTEMFGLEAARIRAALGELALQIEHAGSTSVPGLAAKPVIDVVLVVNDSADEDTYLPALEAAGYLLRIREADWYQHRMFKGPEAEVNLHVFSFGCPEIERMLTFRDWLRENAADRDRYARTKLALAQREWESVQQYADAKSVVVAEIMARAETFRGGAHPMMFHAGGVPRGEEDCAESTGFSETESEWSGARD